MDNDQAKRQRIQDIQRELVKAGLSRRSLLNRLAVMGVGFGAAYMLGLKGADAALGPDAMVSLKSTNPALNDIIEENQQSLVDEATPDGEPIQSAQLEYARGDFKRAYGKEYKKGYTKLYGKEYTKGYTKLYGKEYKKGFGRLYSKEFARIYKKV